MTVVAGDGLFVANTFILARKPLEMNANARLIALAPGLLQFVEQIAHMTRIGEAGYEADCEDAIRTMEGLIPKARALVNKIARKG